jgi:hypothetical protein
MILWFLHSTYSKPSVIATGHKKIFRFKPGLNAKKCPFCIGKIRIYTMGQISESFKNKVIFFRFYVVPVWWNYIRSFSSLVILSIAVLSKSCPENKKIRQNNVYFITLINNLSQFLTIYNNIRTNLLKVSLKWMNVSFFCFFSLIYKKKMIY